MVRSPSSSNDHVTLAPHVPLSTSVAACTGTAVIGINPTHNARVSNILNNRLFIRNTSLWTGKMDIKSGAKAICSTFIVKELGGIESGRRDLAMTVLGTKRAKIIIDLRADLI